MKRWFRWEVRLADGGVVRFMLKRDALWAADLVKRATVEIQVDGVWKPVPSKGLNPIVWDRWRGKAV